MFYFLAQIDHPTITLLRSFDHPTLDEIGTIGNRLGDGVTLIAISLAIGAIGYLRNSHKLKMLSFYSLLAHGLAGLFTQIIKHSLGRPRPRHMDKGPWEIEPSFESGYDSFPSGHASASFAVAMTLAYYFPKGKYLWFGIAAFIATCRVTKGSHFPTDVLGGILVGLASGMVLIYSREKWRYVAQRILAQGLPWLVAAFGLVWIVVPHSEIELDPSALLFIGLCLLLVGLGLRLYWIRESTDPNRSEPFVVPLWPRLLMGLGLASSTGSVIIVGAAMLAGIAWWVGNDSQPLFQSEEPNKFMAGLNPIVIEAVLGIGMFLLVLLSSSIRSP